MKRALQITLGISLFAVAFSGVLSYPEVFGQTAAGNLVEARSTT